MKNGPYELIVAPMGYPGKLYRNKYAYEHIINWWVEYDMVPEKGMEIHHLNGNHRDNRIENLKLVTNREHRKIHSDLKRKPQISYNCGWCNSYHSRTGRNYRYNLKNNKSGLLFCSKSCGSKFHSRIK